MIQFLNLWYLWFLPILAVPALLNIWKKNRIRTIRFPYFFLLAESTKSRITYLKIINILLLLLRTAIILLLIMIMARPVARSQTLFQDSTQSYGPVVFILDNSPSMRMEYAGISLFERAKYSIEQHLAALPRSVPCAVITMNAIGRPEINESYGNTENLITLVRQTHIQRSRFDPHTAATIAASFLKNLSMQHKKIAIYTDNQKPNWIDHPAISLGPDTNVYIVAPLSNKNNDMGWNDVSLPSRLLIQGNKVSISATLKNYTNLPIQESLVQCIMNNTLFSEKIIILEDEQSKTLSFTIAPEDTDFTKITLHAISAQHSFEPALYFSIPRYPAPNIVMSVDGDASLYISTALHLYSSRITEKTMSDLTAAPSNVSSDETLIISAALDEEQSTVVSTQIANGHDAIIFAHPIGYNQSEIAPVSVVDADFDHYILSPFKTTGLNLFDDVHIGVQSSKHILPAALKRRTIIMTQDQQPFLEEITVLNNTALVFYTDAAGQSSNFVQSSVFVPLLHRALDYLAVKKTHAPEFYNKFDTAPITLSDDMPFSIEWTYPNGDSITEDSVFINGKYNINNLPTPQPGYYAMKKSNGEESVFAVNIPLDEGNLAQIDRDTLKSQFLDSPVIVTDIAEEFTHIPSVAGTAPNRVLIICTMLLILTELAVSNKSA